MEHFLKKKKKDHTISSETMQLLTSHDWPGNVRELENAVESATVLSKDVIEPKHLPSSVTHRMGTAVRDKIDKLPGNLNLDQRLQELEKGMIIEALIHTDGVQKKAATQLGIKERSLWHRIKKYRIDTASFRHNNL